MIRGCPWVDQVDSWEKQGIPVTRLSSLDCALGIVEELSRLEEVSDKEVPLVSSMVPCHCCINSSLNQPDFSLYVFLETMEIHRRSIQIYFIY